jgi:hypothetical protein
MILINRSIHFHLFEKDFHDAAYRANDRRELIQTITNYINRSLCLIIPPGVHDEDMLSPMIAWIRNKIKLKMEKSNELEKKSLTNKAATHNHVKNRHKANSNNNESLSAFGRKRNDDELNNKSEFEEEFDPFQRTGCPFGSLGKEVKFRYAKYCSDFKDALNLHCLIAFVFTFTVCITPALSFGGILGLFKIFIKYFK